MIDKRVEQTHQTFCYISPQNTEAVQPFLLKIWGHLLRYFTKISPRRAKARLWVIFVHASYLPPIFPKG